MAIPGLKHVLDGVTAGVVGLIVVTTLGHARTAVPSLPAAAIGGVALLAVYGWQSTFAVPVIMLAAGLAGVRLF